VHLVGLTVRIPLSLFPSGLSSRSTFIHVLVELINVTIMDGTQI
jgi:hypothetical protein